MFYNFEQAKHLITVLSVKRVQLEYTSGDSGRKPPLSTKEIHFLGSISKQAGRNTLIILSFCEIVLQIIFREISPKQNNRIETKRSRLAWCRCASLSNLSLDVYLEHASFSQLQLIISCLIVCKLRWTFCVLWQFSSGSFHSLETQKQMITLGSE